MRSTLLFLVLAASACAARPQVSTTIRDEALEHYARGESLDAIARDLQLPDRDAARAAVHDGMLSLSKRYYREQ